MASFPYVATSNIFNTADYNILDEGLTRDTADHLYLSLSGGTIGGNLNVLGTLSINSVAVDLSFITGVVAGTASASKALVLDSSSNIVGINEVSSSFLEVNNTSSTPITSSSNSIDYGLHLHSILASSNGVYSGSSISFNNSNANNVPLSNIYLEKISGSNGQLVFGTRNGATCDERMRILDTGVNITGGLTTSAVITTNFTNNTGSLLSYQQWSNTVGTPINVALQMSSSGTRIGTTSNHNFRLMSNNGIAVYMDSSQNVTIGTGAATSGYKFDCTGACLMQSTLNLSNLANRSRFRTSTISSSGGLEIYDDQFNALSSTMLNFKTGNNSSPTFIRMAGFQNDNTTMVANGQPHDIRYQSGLVFCGGLNISAINTVQASNVNYNVVLSARNGTIPHFVVNDQFNQAHIHPLDLAELNTSYTQNIIFGKKTRFRDNLYIDGNNSSIYVKSNGGSNSRTSLDFEDDAGKVYEYGIRGSAETPRGWYWYCDGAHRACLTITGRFGIGTTTPRCGLEVAGNVSQTTIPFGTNTYQYNVSSDTWTNLGGGPVNYTICAHFQGNIYVNNSVYNASDRRLKENIKVLDIDIEHYKKLNPVSYNYKNDKKSQLGFIAQEMRSICGEAVSYADNENLKVEEEDDIEGIQMNIDYKQITVMNTAVIKILLDKIEKLEKKISNKV